jgi:hypothetical protein
LKSLVHITQIDALSQNLVPLNVGPRQKRIR